MHTENIYYLLLFHGNNCYSNAPQYYVYSYIASFAITKLFC